MVSRTAILAFAASVAAQANYGPDAYGSDSWGSSAPAQTTTAPQSTVVPTTTETPLTTYACNPAHQYPAGVTCTEISGSLTLVTPTSSAAASSSSSPQQCYDLYNKCRGAADANFSYCASQYAACLGYNPFTGTGGVAPSATQSASSGLVSSSKASPSDVYVTQVVTAFTTVCPSPTTFTYQSKTYTVTSATTLTITDCPCTHTTPVKSLEPSTTVTAIVSSFTTVCPSPTTVTIQSKTYTVTKATTLTITDCPGGCTITTPVSKLPPPVTVTPSASASVPVSKPSNGSAITTVVVTQYTTDCPTPTTVTVQSKTYTVSTSTVLTIPCPGGCTITTPVSMLPGSTGVAPSGSVVVPPVRSSATSSQGAVYTGAADKVAGSGALLIGALGLLAL